jgi:NhaP-type Na+/H+ or K+/H+ antiporter
MDSYDILFCFINFFITLIGSCSIGCFLGIIIALIYKYIDFKHHRLSAVSLFISTVYIPFFLAEILQISGIVTILFTGIASSWYINKHLSKAQKCQASFIFQLIAYLAETSCFCLLGLSIFSQSFEYFRFDLISIVLTLLIVSRAMHVYPLLSLVSSRFICRNSLMHEISTIKMISISLTIRLSL